jgi:hypothetical protein
VQLLEPAPIIILDGRAVRSTTRTVSAGAYQFVISTILPGTGIELQSSYIGHGNLEETQITHLLLALGHCETELRSVPHYAIPVQHGRRRCLYDHLQRLQDFVRDLGHDVSIDAFDDALLLAVEA